MSRWKSVIVVAAGLGSFLLVKLLAGGFGAVGGTYLVDQFAAGPSAAEIISELRGQGYRMYDVMEQQLPEDYAALTQEIAAIVLRRPTAAQTRDQGPGTRPFRRPRRSARSTRNRCIRRRTRACMLRSPRNST